MAGAPPPAGTVSEAARRRFSTRAFRPDPVDAAVVREILETAALAPSGGNLQPWRVYALAGAPLAALKQAVADRPDGEPAAYHVYPPNLWDPFRTRRYQNGEDLYRAIGIPREDKPARLRQLARNGELFGAPVGLFFYIDRGLGPPQWADLGMYMQTVMLLAAERGLDTCAQEYWARYAQTVADFLKPPEEQMLFSGMALGWGDHAHPINNFRAARDPFEAWGELRGFGEGDEG